MRDVKTEQLYRESVVNIVELANVDKVSNGALASRCYPVRSQLDVYKQINKTMFGDHTSKFDEILKEGGKNGREIMGYLTFNPSVYDDIAKNLSKNKDLINSYGIHRRFEIKHGAVFTLTNPLIDRLLDLNEPSDSVPASLLAPPFDCVFLEFGSSDDRQLSKVRTHFHGKDDVIVEGVYISEFEGMSEYNSPEAKRHFGIDEKTRFRIIEVAVSFSPLSFIKDDVFSDGMLTPLMTYFMLCIPDEMSLNECIALSRSWLKDNVDVLDEILPLVFNALLYIGLDNRVEQKIVVGKNKQEQSKKGKVKPFKQHKKALKETQAYNTIKIGSTVRYAPFNDVIKSVDTPKGTKAPHVRRGYFAIRHIKGEDGTSTPQIRRIKTSIINKDMIPNDELELLMKTYEVM